MSLLIANRRSLAHSGLMESPRDFAMLLSIVAVSLGICNGSTLKYVHAITAEWGALGWVRLGRCQDANAGDNVRQLPMSGLGQEATRWGGGGGAAAAGSGTPIRMGNRGGLGSVQVRVSSYEQHISVSAHEMLWKRSIFKMQNVAQNVNRDEGTTERYTEKYDFHLFFYGR